MKQLAKDLRGVYLEGLFVVTLYYVDSFKTRSSRSVIFNVSSIGSLCMRQFPIAVDNGDVENDFVFG